MRSARGKVFYSRPLFIRNFLCFLKKKKRIYTAGAIAVIIYMSFLHPLGIFCCWFCFWFCNDWDKALQGRVFMDNYNYWPYLVCSKTLTLAGIYDRAQMLSFSEITSNVSDWKTWPSTHFQVNLRCIVPQFEMVRDHPPVS